MIKIRLKNRSYGFIYSESLPDNGYEEVKIPVDRKRVSITGDYFDIANNHCACVCTMNIALILRKHRIGDISRCRLGNDRLNMFKDIHSIVGDGPVFLYKPKLNRYLRSVGSKIRAVPITELKDIEDCIESNIPVAMLVNAGITNWHWVLVIGIRKYSSGDIYFNILDGWNRRTDRYLTYNERETFIRALRPVAKR